MAEAAFLESGDMSRNIVRNQYIFERGSFLADFQFAVPVGSFEIQMQVEQSVLNLFIRKSE